MTDLLRILQNKYAINKGTYNRLRTVGLKPNTLSELASMHKLLSTEFPAFRPILLVIGTIASKFVNFLVPILSDITQNEFTVKDSFSDVDEILMQDNS